MIPQPTRAIPVEDSQVGGAPKTRILTLLITMIRRNFPVPPVIRTILSERRSVIWWKLTNAQEMSSVGKCLRRMV